MKRAPFTKEQVARLQRWQTSRWVHPFTCCDHQTMTVEERGFVCPKCGHVQAWCHDFMLEPLPLPDPFGALRKVAGDAYDGVDPVKFIKNLREGTKD